MKRVIMMLFTVCALSSINAQSNKIEIGTIDTINSKILNEKRAIWINVPNNPAKSTPSKTRYPVVYLLDGDWHFVSVVGMLQQLSFINGNTICPEMIIVGIPSIDRYKDMTPTCDSMYSASSGKNENFISFLEKELIPYIDSVYPVEPYRVLIGHSLGGLTVINTMVNHTNLFNAYVAIDPSMWWNNQSSLRETEKALASGNFLNTSLFLAIANSMDRGMDTVRVRTDKTRNSLPIRSLLVLSDILNRNSDNKLDYQIKYYPNENHGSVPLIATYDALHSVFSFYHMPLTKSDYADTTMSLGYRIENHYRSISEKMGYRITPSENTINTLGYNAIFLKNLTLAEYFFKLNTVNYPNSYNAYDSYGDYFMAVGNAEQAIKMYKKALSIYDNIDTRNKLESITRE